MKFKMIKLGVSIGVGLSMIITTPIQGLAEEDEDSNMPKLYQNTEESSTSSVMEKSNWKEENFNLVLPEEMKQLSKMFVKIEDKTGINSVILASIVANETGWGKHVRNNNYFNWYYKGYKKFNSIEELTEYSIKGLEKYTRPEWYNREDVKVEEDITLKVMNRRYALNSDGSTNTNWEHVTKQIVVKLSKQLKKHLAELEEKEKEDKRRAAKVSRGVTFSRKKSLNPYI